MAAYYSREEDGYYTDSSDDEEPPFKELLTKNERQNCYELLKDKCPEFIPVIIEKSKYDKFLPKMKTSKYLLYPGMKMCDVMQLIRKNMELDSIRCLYLLVRRGILVSMSKSVLELYAEHRESDGFLYFTYASEDVFGSDLTENL